MKFKVIILTLIIFGITHLSSAQTGGAFGQITYKKVLANNSPTGIFSVSLPSGGMTGGCVCFTITATDGTDFQSHSGLLSFSGVNKGGVYTTNIGEIMVAESFSKSVGTFTDTWTISTGVNLITINVNSNSSLGVSPVIIWTLFSDFKNNVILL